MIKQNVLFKQFTSTQYCFNISLKDLSQLIPTANTIIITDKNVYAYYKKKLHGYKIIIPKTCGEEIKSQQTVNHIIQQLIELKADKTTYLIGLGGGTITDLVGYIASIYMRGVKLGLIPTTILAMVDAAVGGKNGINIHHYKNTIGTIYQPSFVLYDYTFLKTLPYHEWINGFAEIIKHACIKDAAMFKFLAEHNIRFFQKNKQQLATLIKENVLLKLKIVQKDSQEKAERYLLNFGHTLAHAIERKYKISHGQAVAIGMVIDCKIAEKYFNFTQIEKLLLLLRQYELPVQFTYNKKDLVNILKMDKKKMQNELQYIILKKIGKAYIKKVAITDLLQWI